MIGYLLEQVDWDLLILVIISNREVDDVGVLSSGHPKYWKCEIVRVSPSCRDG